MDDNAELIACSPERVVASYFNQECELPYGLTTEHLRQAMEEFIDFLGFINARLWEKRLPRLETLLMPATFSGIVSEFMCIAIPRYCPGLVRNRYHNGHPDLIPKGRFSNDAVQYATEGIEVKASQRARGWQGHNPESGWLMVFHFESNTANDIKRGAPAKPFRFMGVYAARLDTGDWSFSGRSGVSRRTITASVNSFGMEKMRKNWVYQHHDSSKKLS